MFDIGVVGCTSSTPFFILKYINVDSQRNINICFSLSSLLRSIALWWQTISDPPSEEHVPAGDTYHAMNPPVPVSTAEENTKRKITKKNCNLVLCYIDHTAYHTADLHPTCQGQPSNLTFVSLLRCGGLLRLDAGILRLATPSRILCKIKSYTLTPRHPSLYLIRCRLARLRRAVRVRRVPM